MPLPDERPRQSVANLIGRFESQKRQQPPNSSGSRSSSVISHTTGESTKEEVKEKREWPPKSVSNNDKPPPIVPSSSWTRSLSSRSQPFSSPNPEPAATQSASNEDLALTPRPNSTTSIPDAAKISSPKRQLSIGVSIPNPTSLSTPTPTTPKPINLPVSKPPIVAIPKTPLRTAGRNSTNHAPSTQPIKPQHTGSASVPTSARKPIAKPVSTTPSRAKTPSRAVSNTTRPKTPTTVPKTSGLFAPTAASLARARNAQPQVQTPVKKAAVSSTSMDRLSKPTAASLSRARTPTSTPSTPSRGIKPAARGGVTRGTAKPRLASPPVRTQEIPPIPDVAKTTTIAAAAAAASGAGLGIASASEGQTDDKDAPPETNGHHPESPNPTATESRISHQEDSMETEIPIVQTEAESEQSPDLEHVDHTVEVVPTTESDGQTSDHELLAEVESHDLDKNGLREPEAAQVPEERLDEVKARVHVGNGNDIEDIVNLLESTTVSKPRPESIASIPDEVSEIPDEE